LGGKGEGLDLWFSCLLIHVCQKVGSEARMEPPTHTDACAQSMLISPFITLGVSGELPLHPIGKAFGTRLWYRWSHQIALRWDTCHVLWTVTLHPGGAGSFMNVSGSQAQEGRLEEPQGSRTTCHQW